MVDRINVSINSLQAAMEIRTTCSKWSELASSVLGDCRRRHGIPLRCHLPRHSAEGRSQAGYSLDVERRPAGSSLIEAIRWKREGFVLSEAPEAEMATSTIHAADRDVSRKADERRQSSSLAWEEAAVRLDLEQWIVDRLRHPVETSTSYLQLLRDSGSALCLPLLKVRHADRFSSTIGSLSLAADIQLKDCEALASDRTWQAALLGLPCDGVSYSVVCDEDELSERETLRLLDLVARQLNRPQAAGSILFPGRGCRREFMGKLFGVIRSSRDVVVTGKPDCLGGLNLDEFAAEGIAAIVSSLLLRKGQRIQGAKVAVEGFRALGQAISQRLARDGLRLVALSDNSGGIYRGDGLILPDVNSQINREQVLFGYSRAERHQSRGNSEARRGRPHPHGRFGRNQCREL